MQQFNIGIIEDDRNLRGSLEDYFAISPRYKVVFSSETFRKTSELNSGIPDFILLDIHLNGESGIDLITQIKDRYPHASIIVVTGDTHDKQHLIRAFELGAASFLYKPFQFAEVEKAINQIVDTGSFLEPQLLTQLLGSINNRNKENTGSRFFDLTDKEDKVMQLIKQGLTYKEIASALHISYHTVNHHLKNIYLKLNVNSKAQLLALFLK